MLDELAMVFQVIRRPNSAFAALRDNDRRYFQSSIVVVLLISIASVGLGLATPEIAGQPTMDVATSFGLAVLGNVAIAGTIYIIGRAFGGNKSWKKVLTVILYAEVIWIPAAATSLLSSLLSSHPSLGLQTMVGTVVLAAFVWAIIISVKAVKVLNGFGTAKAFGILILTCIIQLIWIIPILLLYLWPILADLPVTQMPLQ